MEENSLHPTSNDLQEIDNSQVDLEAGDHEYALEQEIGRLCRDVQNLLDKNAELDAAYMEALDKYGEAREQLEILQKEWAELEGEYCAQIRELQAQVHAAREGDSMPAIIPWSIVSSVKDFMLASGQPISIYPSFTDRDLINFRARLMQEELNEYKNAFTLPEIADAVADMLYVLIGTALTHGLPLKELMVEVCQSNASKIGEDGKVVKDKNGKVLKPEWYEPPDVEKVLRRFGWDG